MVFVLNKSHQWGDELPPSQGFLLRSSRQRGGRQRNAVPECLSYEWGSLWVTLLLSGRAGRGQAAGPGRRWQCPCFPLAGARALSAGLSSDMFSRVPQQPVEEHPWAPPFSRCPGHAAHRGAKLGFKSKASDPRVSPSARFFFHGSALIVQRICPFVCLVLNLAWTLPSDWVCLSCLHTRAHTCAHAHTPSCAVSESLVPTGALRCWVLGASPLLWLRGMAWARLQHECGCRCRHLEHNSLVEVNSGSLYGLTALHQLHLSNNSISRISRDGWSFCQKLHEL